MKLTLDPKHLVVCSTPHEIGCLSSNGGDADHIRLSSKKLPRRFRVQCWDGAKEAVNPNWGMQKPNSLPI